MTQYQLFTPMKLPMDLACTTLSTLEATPEPHQGTTVVLKRTMRTHAWDQVRNQLYVMRNYLRQADAKAATWDSPLKLPILLCTDTIVMLPEPQPRQLRTVGTELLTQRTARRLNIIEGLHS